MINIESQALVKKALKFVIDNNKGMDNPYHNTIHCYDVYVTVATYFNSSFTSLSGVEEQNTKIAAIFHDFNHIGQKGDDSVNIEHALNGFKEFVSLNVKYFNIDIINRIIHLIKMTQYPTPYQELDGDFCAKLIRDADMCVVFKDSFIDYGVFKLAKEFGVSIGEQVDNQIKFIENLKFNTEYYQHKWTFDSEFQPLSFKEVCLMQLKEFKNLNLI